MDNNNPTYQEALAGLKDQLATMLEMCDGSRTPAICKLLTVEGNKTLLIEAIIELIKKGYKSDQAITLLEREYNLNAPEDF